MFCPKCGAKNQDSAVFCANCGQKVEFTQTNSVNPTAQNQTMSAFTPNGIQNSPFGAQDPVMTAVKSFAGSTEALIAAIAFTLAIIFPLFNSGIGSNLSNLYLFDSSLDLDDLIGFNIFDMITRTATVIASIPNIIIAVGIWITIASGLDKLKSLISTAGLTMIEIVIKIQAVLLIIGGGLYTILMIFAIVETYSEMQDVKDTFFGYTPSYYSSSIFTLVLFLIIGLAAIAFLVWCKLQYSTLASNMKLTANMRKPMTVPVSCVVLTIISTVGVAISLIFTVSMNSLLGGFGFTIFGMLSQIVANVMFVVIMTKYNDVMTRLKFQTSTLLCNGAPTNDFNYR